MASDPAETPSPQPLPEGREADVRITRLHDALKHLKSKRTAPPSPLPEELPHAPPDAAAAVALEPAPQARPPAPPVEAPGPEEVLALPSLEPPPEVRAAPEQAAAPAPSPPVAPPPLLPAAASPRPPALEDVLSSKALGELDRIVDVILAQAPAKTPAAIALAAVDAWQDVAGIASRLAWRLAERKEGATLLVEEELSTRSLEPSAPAWGLTDAVAGRADWEQAIAPTAVAGLFLLGAGSPLPPEEIPLSQQWRSAVAQLKQRFRYLVTAVRPTQNVESAAWASAFDGVYVAVELGRTTKAAAARAVEILRARGATIRGCVALD